jgi:hypothetical protein
MIIKLILFNYNLLLLVLILQHFRKVEGVFSFSVIRFLFMCRLALLCLQSCLGSDMKTAKRIPGIEKTGGMETATLNNLLTIERISEYLSSEF